jgi:hypothetical protein
MPRRSRRSRTASASVRVKSRGLAGTGRATIASAVAIGLVGIVATSSLSILGGTAGTFGAYAVTGSNASELRAGTAGPATTVGPAMAAAAASSTVPASSAMKAAVPENPASLQDALAVTSASPPVPGPQCGAVDTGSAGNGVRSPAWSQVALASSTGLDARLVWLGGFGLLFLAGLGVLIVPLIRRRKTR